MKDLHCIYTSYRSSLHSRARLGTGLQAFVGIYQNSIVLFPNQEGPSCFRIFDSGIYLGHSNNWCSPNKYDACKYDKTSGYPNSKSKSYRFAILYLCQNLLGLAIDILSGEVQAASRQPQRGLQERLSRTHTYTTTDYQPSITATLHVSPSLSNLSIFQYLILASFGCVPELTITVTSSVILSSQPSRRFIPASQLNRPTGVNKIIRKKLNSYANPYLPVLGFMQ
jgi:hypothetical protein